MMNKLLNADKEKAKEFLHNPIGLKQKRIGRPIVSFAVKCEVHIIQGQFPSKSQYVNSAYSHIF
jgi:hypothetical protein